LKLAIPTFLSAFTAFSVMKNHEWPSKSSAIQRILSTKSLAESFETTNFQSFEKVIPEFYPESFFRFFLICGKFL